MGGTDLFAFKKLVVPSAQGQELPDLEELEGVPADAIAAGMDEDRRPASPSARALAALAQRALAARVANFTGSSLEEAGILLVLCDWDVGRALAEHQQHVAVDAAELPRCGSAHHPPARMLPLTPHTTGSPESLAQFLDQQQQRQSSGWATGTASTPLPS